MIKFKRQKTEDIERVGSFCILGKKNTDTQINQRKNTVVYNEIYLKDKRISLDGKGVSKRKYDVSKLLK